MDWLSDSSQKVKCVLGVITADGEYSLTRVMGVAIAVAGVAIAVAVGVLETFCLCLSLSGVSMVPMVLDPAIPPTLPTLPNSTSLCEGCCLQSVLQEFLLAVGSFLQEFLLPVGSFVEKDALITFFGG